MSENAAATSDKTPAFIVWRIRFFNPALPGSGRFQTLFVLMDRKAEILTTPAIATFFPHWVGMNFVTLSHMLYREYADVSCKQVCPVCEGYDGFIRDITL
jgi:hypothetical protein